MGGNLPLKKTHAETHLSASGGWVPTFLEKCEALAKEIVA
jgi:hypothetical protein